MNFPRPSPDPPPRLPRRKHCGVCDDYGVVSASWAYSRGPACTCGADSNKGNVWGYRADEMILHDYDCDSLPCPFCPLLSELGA
jgi:hypothetical protein